MAPIIDPAKVTQGAAQDLAQFEPDPEGLGNIDPPASEDAGDPQWIVWPDAADESAWAADELKQIGAGSVLSRPLR